MKIIKNMNRFVLLLLILIPIQLQIIFPDTYFKYQLIEYLSISFSTLFIPLWYLTAFKYFHKSISEKKLEKNKITSKANRLFVINTIFIYIYFNFLTAGPSVFNIQLNDFVGFLIPFQLYLAIANIHANYHISKIISLYDHKNRFIYFFLLMIPPIGIFFIQPKLNEIKEA